MARLFIFLRLLAIPFFVIAIVALLPVAVVFCLLAGLVAWIGHLIEPLTHTLKPKSDDPLVYTVEETAFGVAIDKSGIGKMGHYVGRYVMAGLMVSTAVPGAALSGIRDALKETSFQKEKAAIQKQRGYTVAIAEPVERVPPRLLAWYRLVSSLALAWMPVTILKNRAYGLIGRLTKQRDPRQLQRSSSFWFDGWLFIGSKDMRSTRRESASAFGLNLVYHRFGRFGRRSRNTDSHILARLTDFHADAWYSMPVAIEVRDRVDVATGWIKRGIVDFRKRYPSHLVEILDVAGGCGYLSMRACHEALEQEGFDFRIRIVDDDHRVAKLIEENCRELGIDTSKVLYHKSKISGENDDMSLNTICEQIGVQRESIAVGVMIGLLDYKTDDGSKKLIRQLRSLVASHGMMITCNIRDHGFQRIFLRELLHWPMNFRSLDRWIGILDDAGCDPSQTRVSVTPKGMFMVTAEQVNQPRERKDVSL